MSRIKKMGEITVRPKQSYKNSVIRQFCFDEKWEIGLISQKFISKRNINDGWQFGNEQHLFSFVNNFPEKIKKFPVVALCNSKHDFSSQAWFDSVSEEIVINFPSFDTEFDSDTKFILVKRIS